ncbi:MAG: hypothetical protein DSM107014_15750 [Gomphosphaeria aponina SAG 52.96 = DSM 107014]|uniref:PEP-CTERM sorting domain-containing protein n=1 Tax=Gomphosphaeria aponina SAG 52.96 = DSM 107014 TaxID=1521640 RepID=A0A941GT40_9CHRO|nr:hypothetical protein [Gomphosphaeria aponina SAG 52.96 = DSM 107014]
MKSKTRKGLIVLTITTVFFTVPSVAKAVTLYEYESLTIDDADFTAIKAINNQGQIIGDTNAGGVAATSFFINQNGEKSFFDAPGAAATLVWDMNENEEIVGYFFTTPEFVEVKPFILNDSNFIVPDLFPDRDDIPDIEFSGINNNGQIVGFYFNEDFTDASGFFINEPNFNEIDATDVEPIIINNADKIFPWGINDQGDIAGQFRDEKGTQGFFLEEDEIKKINFPGADLTRARGLNNNDEIVGLFTLPETGDTWRSFIWEDDNFVEIAFPGAVETLADNINDAGVIVGQYVDSEGNINGFKATPIPEPEITSFGGFVSVFALGLAKKFSRRRQ